MQITKYVKSEAVSLAYRISGDAGPTLLHVPGAISNLALEEIDPNGLRYFERMSRFCRAVRFDKRATGLSDRSAAPPTLTQQVPDVEAVARPRARTSWRSMGSRRVPPWQSCMR